MYPKVVALPVKINLKIVTLGAAAKKKDWPVPKLLKVFKCMKFVGRLLKFLLKIEGHVNQRKFASLIANTNQDQVALTNPWK